MIRSGTRRITDLITFVRKPFSDAGLALLSPEQDRVISADARRWFMTLALLSERDLSKAITASPANS